MMTKRKNARKTGKFRVGDIVKFAYDHYTVLGVVPYDEVAQVIDVDPLDRKKLCVLPVRRLDFLRCWRNVVPATAADVVLIGRAI
jgi:hypothetical protein